MIILAKICRSGFIGSKDIENFKSPNGFAERLVPIKIPIKSVLACLFHLTPLNMEHYHHTERFLKGNLWEMVLWIFPLHLPFQILYFVILINT